MWASSHCHHQGSCHQGLGGLIHLIVPMAYSNARADLVPLTVDGTVRVISSLVMKWDAILGLVHLSHLRLGARSSSQIRVSSTGCEVRRSRSEVVLRKRGDASADATSVLLRRVVIRLVSTRVE